MSNIKVEKGIDNGDVMLYVCYATLTLSFFSFSFSLYLSFPFFYNVLLMKCSVQKYSLCHKSDSRHSILSTNIHKNNGNDISPNPIKCFLKGTKQLTYQPIAMKRLLFIIGDYCFCCFLLQNLCEAIKKSKKFFQMKYNI